MFSPLVGYVFILYDTVFFIKITTKMPNYFSRFWKGKFPHKIFKT